MQLYLHVTGGRNLKGFWKMTPAELAAWADVRAEGITKGKDGFEDMLPGEEIED